MTRHLFRRVVPAVAVTLAAVGVVVAADKTDKDKPAKTRVEMKRMQFIPEEVTIKKGGTVQWVNNDDRDYLIKADDGSFQSDNIRPKGTFEHTFKSAGKFAYKNFIRMREGGTITVEE